MDTCLDNLHAISQRSRDGLQLIGGRYKDDVAKVKNDIQIGNYYPGSEKMKNKTLYDRKKSQKTQK